MRTFDWYQNWWPWMTLDRPMAVILHYYIECVSFLRQLRQIGWSQTHIISRDVARILHWGHRSWAPKARESRRLSRRGGWDWGGVSLSRNQLGGRELYDWGWEGYGPLPLPPLATPLIISDRNVLHRMQFLTSYHDLWRYSQRLLRTSALNRGNPCQHR